MARQARKPRSRRPVCRGWPNHDKRVSSLDHSRQTRPGDARPGRRICPRNHSSPGPGRGSLMVLEFPAAGDAMPRLKPSYCRAVSLLPHFSRRRCAQNPIKRMIQRAQDVKSWPSRSSGRRRLTMIMGNSRWGMAHQIRNRPPAPPFMILKPCPSLSRTKLQDHGSTGGGTAATP